MQNDKLREQLAQSDSLRQSTTQNDQIKAQNQQLSQRIIVLESDLMRSQREHQNKDEEIYQLRSGMQNRISAPDNSHQLILQINHLNQENEDLKNRLGNYVESNAELKAQLLLVQQQKQGGGMNDENAYMQNSDKDQLIHKYRIENKRLQQENHDLQISLRNYEGELRNIKMNKGWGCSG